MDYPAPPMHQTYSILLFLSRYLNSISPCRYGTFCSKTISTSTLELTTAPLSALDTRIDTCRLSSSKLCYPKEQIGNMAAVWMQVKNAGNRPTHLTLTRLLNREYLYSLSSRPEFPSSDQVVVMVYSSLFTSVPGCF